MGHRSWKNNIFKFRGNRAGFKQTYPDWDGFIIIDIFQYNDWCIGNRINR